MSLQKQVPDGDISRGSLDRDLLACLNNKTHRDTSYGVLHRRLIHRLLTSASVGVLTASLCAFSMVSFASADCVTDDKTVTCTGDLSDGVSKITPGTEILNVNSLTTDIEPDSGTRGVALTGTGTVQITYEGGDQDILTTGEPAAGIVGLSTGVNGSDGITLDFLAYSVGTDGTHGTSADAVNITSSGAISTDGEYGHGILAISQGADGGDGGSGSGAFAGNGGDGGAGGYAGTVTVTNFSTISTASINSQAIYAQSLGGTGGDGGPAGDAVSAIAGDPGTSRTGSTITIINNGALTTAGEFSNGILAQSLGGFGGDGGDAGSIFYSEGSDGVTGAAGGTVNVTNSGTIITHNDTAYGILAQSVGGGGGSGGDAGAIGSVGGSGAGGGAGGQVNLDNTGSITTHGEVSLGILAQSVGGGGGDGGSAAGIASIGGDGAAGAAGDTVDGSHSGTISTSGTGSIGLLVQSIGGGGGHGGESDALVAIGGQGGGGGDGGSISFDTSGDVTTTGERADAIQIQSVGGGGGKGGTAGSISPGVSITIGGAGGDGGDGNDVTVNEDNTATSANAALSTTKDHSAGLAVSSIGGGGGSGGWALSAAAGPLGVAIAIGGQAGGGGNGGAVEVKNNGTIHTRGNHSVGLSAQSTGGGGGTGGYAIAISAGASGSVSVGIGGDAGDGGSSSTVDLTSWTDVITEQHHSIGIIGSSVGGGGGNGGFSVGVSSSPLASFDVTIGGGGGNAGHSDTVTVTSTGTIQTSGDHSYGLVAQSLGGGGGNGGYSIGVDASGMNGGSVGIGGDGAGGGNAGEALLTNTGTIITQGDHAYAILAQSVGGGGGNGGHVIDASAASVGSAVVSIGGSGSGGGDGDIASAISIGDLTTTGNNSYGLLAQSIGGGGGNGGYTIGGAGSLGASASVTIGGSGAGGGDGAKVTADSTGTVITSGDLSHGLFAQSLGGGGGNGGYSIAGTLSTTVSASVAIGGSGAGGGDGGEVTLTNVGDVTTTGGHANALLAQSLGGGGGNGGFSAAGDVTISPEGAGVSAAVSIGGQGGAGGTSDTVTINSTGSLETGGHSSSGIFAQSIGGGGGSGGASVEGILSVSSDFSMNVGVSIAGSGGTGSSSSNVSVGNSGSISTGGENSTAILAQSIGGGGGNGGFSVTAAIEASGDGGANVGVSLSGDGGSGNDGGIVSVTSQGDLTTTGNNSSAIFAQSLGGGGGNGGFSVAADASNVNTVDVSISGSASDGGTANDVTVKNAGIVQTGGANSYGIQAQSLGGAGGNGGLSVAASATTSSDVNVSVSGNGGSGGSSGVVILEQLGSVTTTGAGSYGLFAQSLGGGGGNGGASIEGALTISSGSSVAVGVSVAGAGGTGGVASNVELGNFGPVQTSGDNATAILAQSIGGGGGNGGFSIAASLDTGDSGGDIGVSVSGSGGSGNDAGAVNVITLGDITTGGDNAVGVQAQSIGGGGGNGGFSVAGAVSNTLSAQVSVAGGAGDGGIGAAVHLENAGTISTVGNHSYGLFAQSLGGAGGNGGFSVAGSLTTSSSANVSVSGGGGSGGTSDKVSLYHEGGIMTEGSGAHGVFAQSLGGGGGNGGFSVDGALTVSSESSATVGVSVAGGGGDGATSSTVDVINIGSIQVSGDNASGIFAQSVGGSGGNGGFSVSGDLTYGSDTSGSLGVSVAGDGGIGSFGADVTIDNSGDLITEGANGTAILAQSIGGGGGNGGFSVTGSLVISDDSAAVGVSVGGAGGAGSDGGIVQVTSEGSLSTSGDNASGILAQSVGGGGGNGGFSGAFDGGKKGALSVSVGGAAADGGFAGAVTVDSTGTIVTAGSLSYGILAQSVGGSGGNGGFSLSGSLSTNASLGVSVGGGGGDGGTADDVSLEHAGSVVTSGAGAHGLFAQSVGGGGGTGGFSGAADITFEGKADIGVSIGGGGGDGGTAGAASLTSQDGILVWTKADGAVGLLAQSVGGGGGDGGFSFAANLGLSNTGSSTTNVGVTIGGSGGSGGTGNTVDLTNSIRIVTAGDYAHGIQAQSIGGSGGTGGLSVSGSANLSTDSSNNLNVAVGGGGGTGNTADIVTVDNSGDVSTSGGSARGLFVQSVGGGGGNGGLSFAGTLAGGGSEGSPKSIGVSVGGSGGTGGDGGEVQLTNSGDVTTTGYLAEGILAQSVGGGGGAGGLAGAAILSYKGDGTNLKINVAVGGTGGAGGIGEAVTLTNTGDVTSTGVASTAIYAQSIGGGGGNGGSSFSGVIDLTKPGGGGEEDDDDESNDRNLTVNVAIGGNAADGASGGTVTVHNEGTLTTVLGSAKGIFAQSVGGGGGSGGASDAFAMEIGSCSNPAIPACETPDFTEKSLAIEVSIGGSGGEGGDGETVTVVNKGGIQTSADGSDAIYAQSVGAGGGEGGNGSIGQNIVTGLPVDIFDTADSILNPPLAFWQEIGVNVGGTGGASGNGGAVSVTNENILITSGDRSSGIFAQSIGGGGGQGGNTDGGFVGVTVGGSGGAAGDSDAVTVSNSGDISTSGSGSLGIFAQSVGGGGGVSGTVSQGFFGTDIDMGIGVGVSQDGGDGGNGGDVSVTTSSTIITTGDGAHGVWAQSVGGGGGTAGSSSSDIGLNFAGTAGDDGDAGTVTVLHTGDITTTGDGSVGIFAQSASGGADGNTGDASDDYALGATGTGKTVSVSVNSSVVTSGDNSIGIVAQSIGLNGDGQIFINIGEDSVITGGSDPDGEGVGNDPVGILVLDGSGNVIENNGIVGTQQGVLGIAIETRETADNESTDVSLLETPETASEFAVVENTGSTILNNGTMTGSIFLAEADNKVINSGTLNAGETVDLGGSDNQFINDGILSPGGADSVSVTTISGDFLQTENGEILLDVDFADNNAGVNTSDEIDVTGVSNLAGTVVVNALNGAFVEPDENGEVTILTSFEEFDDLTIIAPDTEVVNYELRTDDDGNVFLAWDVDFSPAAGDFNPNQTAIANYLVDTIAAGEPENLTAVLNAVLEAPDAVTLVNYYNQLSAEPYLQTEQATVLSNRQFGRRLLQCPKNGLSPETEGCSWLQLDVQRSTQDGEFESLGFEETAIDLQLGIGGRLSERMNALFGVSYAQTSTDTEDYATSEGYRVQGGAGLSYENNGGAIFSVAAIGGFASYDHDRTQTLTGSTVTAQGKQNIYFGSGQARIVQQAYLGGISLAPEIEAWGGYFHHNAIKETGAGATNLDIESGGNAYGSIRPGLTIATEFIAQDGSVLRPYISGGVTYSLIGKNNGRTSLTATMQGDDDLVPAFTVSRTPEDPYFDAQLGLDWVSPIGVSFRIGGTAQFADNYRSYGGSLRLVATF
ncbi:MAG: autotransporter outer membrane beta-barrel domain-containing protein [Proteobacteria bacterium]|nr:autotransporter outer membrane beta-barrel domain-containing protein [Pseudomonadota bacterium]